MPQLVQTPFAEMVNAACASFGMLPLMERAAAKVLMAHADPSLGEVYLPHLVSGNWGATICMSEPEAGSDVGRVRAQATPNSDGTHAINGTKIFVTYGDHDFTDQIAHLLLARTPGAADGTRGLSLFLVPKRMIEPDGTFGAPNHLSVTRVEKKMGLKASPTCILNLDNAVGYLIGKESAGLRNMFTMVNTMRLEVATQGVAIGGIATQRAVEYALERVQGGGPIIEHPDVRRMLMTMRARTDGMRALVYETAKNLDLATVAATDEERREALDLAEWLLPVCKATSTDTGFDTANLCVQVFGGHGYVSDHGVEQYVRDSRVFSIYEGTNGIQAIDLLMRKTASDERRRFQTFCQRVRRDIEQTERNGGTKEIHAALTQALATLEDCTTRLCETLADRRRDALAGAASYLALAGQVGMAWMWLRMASKADPAVPGQAGKAKTARFYAQHLMPACQSLAHQALAGAEALDAISPDELSTY
jgi:alkylation response protein AidB-like acyl-CoA dehydrogenase